MKEGSKIIRAVVSAVFLKSLNEYYGKIKGNIKIGAFLNKGRLF